MLFLVDEGTWTSVVENDWLYLNPSYNKIPLNSNWTNIQVIKTYPTKNKLLKGVENSTECQKELLSKLPCNKKCYPILYNYLGLLPCNNHSELQCMNQQLYNFHEKERLQCYKPKEYVSYQAGQRPSKIPIETPNETGTILSFKFSSQSLVKREEIYLIGTLDFIGNMGGSLGLFLGFSCFPLLSWLNKLLFERITRHT